MITLSLEFWIEKKDFCIYAEAEGYEKEITLAGQAEGIVDAFDTVYDILEEKKDHKTKELEALIQDLSQRIITPFERQLKACNTVRFVVDEDLINCAFDLLLLDGAYLFLQRRICYQIEEGTGDDAPQIELGSALLIADLTADPEEACKAVSELIPDTDYFEMADASARTVRDAASEVDALIISAHGGLEDDNSGELYLNEAGLSASVMEEQEAWLVYFDSCQQGVNMSYLRAFQDESDIQFYLAPIISNDAGDSSTKTMVWFFTGVLEHKDPIRGLYETRKRLFAYYQQQEKLDLVTTLNKAFPFRLYEFVDGEE